MAFPSVNRPSLSIMMAVTALSLIAPAIAAPLLTRAEPGQPGQSLDQPFTLSLYLPFCDAANDIVMLTTYDETDDPDNENGSGLTTTGLFDFQNADGTQVKGPEDSCKFGEIPFTKIPEEPRQFSISVTTQGHSLREKSCSLTFDTDPGRSSLIWLVNNKYVIDEPGQPTQPPLQLGKWSLLCDGPSFDDDWS